MLLKPATHLANLCADSSDRRGVPIAAIAIFADPRDMPDIEDFYRSIKVAAIGE